MITVALIEDDATAMRHLRDSIERFQNSGKSQGTEFNIAEFNEPTSFLDPYRGSYDIVFMDIEMPNMNGMEAARRLRQIDPHTIIIFVTNMAQFAAKGYEVDALAYIIKPFTYNDFEQKLERAVDLCRRKSESIAITQRGEMKIVLLSDLAYIEVKGHTLVFHTDQEELIGSGSLQEVQAKLEGKGFLRSGKSYLVNQRFIKEIHRSEIFMSDGSILPIGRSYHKTFLTQLAQSLGSDHVL